ncbi:MAG: HEAT repeat domain-containing protein [Candidatus Latescibacterota bacterium]|nr:HEAT repeat domain-containing protein [Candidatus Latescibacterota bacterium]
MRFFTALNALCASLFLSACSTTEQQITDYVEQMAANPIDSPAWQESVDGLIAIGRPAARQLTAQLNPGYYVGENYREFRQEQEKLRTGSARVLGRIKPRGVTGALTGRISTDYTEPERIACIWAIGEMGSAQGGIDALKGQMSDENPLIRLHAAIALMKMDDQTGYEEIASALAGSNDIHVNVVLNGLAEAKHFGVPLLGQLTDQGGPNGAALQQTIDQVSAELVEQLNNEDPEMRRRAALALGELGDSQHVDPLVQCLDDPSNQVRFSTAAALAEMGEQAGVDFLFDSMRDPDPILRTNAVKFLTGVQKSTGTVQAQLIKALASQEALARAGAAQVLGQARVLDAVAALQTATGDSDAQVRANAVIALGHIGLPESRMPLEALLEDPDSTVAYYAEWALRQLNSTERGQG